MAPKQAMRSISIDQAIDEYRTYNRAQNYSARYVASADRNLRQFADWLAAEGRALQISRLTLDDARAFIVREQERENQCRPGTRLSPDTVQQYARNLKSWSTFLEAEGFTKSNLFARLRLPKVPVREPEVLTQEEIGRIIGIYNPHSSTGLRNILLVLMLTDTGRVLDVLMVYQGNVNCTIVRMAEVFREAIVVCAPNIILVHNHPSGDPSPSPDDASLTKQAVEAGKLLGIEVLDHVVIGRGCYVSLKDQGVIDGR